MCTPPSHFTPNVIYEIACYDCTATYNGQTNWPLIKRIKKHESHSRLHLHNPDDFSHNQSAPAHHSRTTGHKIACTCMSNPDLPASPFPRSYFIILVYFIILDFNFNIC